MNAARSAPRHVQLVVSKKRAWAHKGAGRSRGMQPETRYARSGDVRIAFQVVGNGPFDIVFIPGVNSNLEIAWESPARAHFFSRLRPFSRLILFDKRNTGLSDRLSSCRDPGGGGWTTSAR